MAHYVTNVETLGVDRTGDGHYGFSFQVYWSDAGPSTMVLRYETLFTFQCELLDMFPEAAGTTGEPRIIPPLPGKKHINRLLAPTRAARESREKALQEKRLPDIAMYMNKLVRLPEEISRSKHVLSLFDQSIKSAPPLARDKDAVFEGVLTKLGHKVRNWKKRHVYLDKDGVVRYYATPRGSRSAMPSGVVLVSDVLEVRGSSNLTCDWPPGTPPENCFGIVTSARTYFFTAPSTAECIKWMGFLQEAVRVMAQYQERVEPGRTESMSSHTPPLHHPSVSSLRSSSRRNSGSSVGQSPAASSTASPRVSRRHTASGSSSSLHSAGRTAWGRDEGEDTEEEEGDAHTDADSDIPPPPPPLPEDVGGAAAAAAGQADKLQWRSAMTPDGDIYYVNVVTKESRWDLPADVVQRLAGIGQEK
eukprot:m.232249 g.232249  ORF g.232249 m.232249 type:complete len:418 (-) comp22438_c0_seq1:60-1313(-)